MPSTDYSSHGPDTPAAGKTLNLMFSAGEASSDTHAAHVVHALKSLNVEFECFGMGADKLSAAGMELILDCSDLAVIGIVDVLLNYHRFLKRLAILREALIQRKPDLLIIVDYPDFNLKLAETAQKHGVPVLFYISPQIWAWRKNRIKRIGQLVDHMAVLFPFEVDVYQQANIAVSYVGHPLVDHAKSALSQSEAQNLFSLNTEQPVIALLPGSRTGELSRNLPVMLAAAKQLQQQQPTCQFILPRASTLSNETVLSLLEDVDVDVKLIDSKAHDVMRSADAVLCASGTATLETAMLGTPMAIMYRVNKLNYAIMSKLIQIDDIGLVNIVAGKRIVQEFIQNAATPEALAQELNKLLNDQAYRSTMQLEMTTVREKMGIGGASFNVARLICSLTKATAD